MSEKVIRSLIEQRLRDFGEDNELPVQWEDAAFTPPATAYLRFNLFPAATQSLDLAGQLRTYTGLAQITICTPSGNGPAAASDILAALDAEFPCDSYLDSVPAVDGVDLQVLIASPITAPNGSTDKVHYVRPATFQYRCDLMLS